MSRRDADPAMPSDETCSGERDVPTPERETTQRSAAVPAVLRRLELTESTLGPAESWSADLVGALSAVLMLPAAALLWWGPDCVHVHNPAFVAELGGIAPPRVGVPIGQSWPAACEALQPLLEIIRADGSTVRERSLTIARTPDGTAQPTVWDVSLGPIPTDSPDPHGVLIVARNVTAEVTEHQLAVAQTENLQVALASNRRIGTAIGILMAQRRITDTAAFDLLRDVSQRDHRKLREVADDVVLTGALPGSDEMS